MEEVLRHLDLPLPGDPSLPNLFLIGDSTVRNGRGDGINGQWGWGDPLAVYFDPAKVNLVNRAVGGTGARTFITIGYWDLVLSMLKPGDFVVMQFGTNNNGPTGPFAARARKPRTARHPAAKRKPSTHTAGNSQVHRRRQDQRRNAHRLHAGAPEYLGRRQNRPAKRQARRLGTRRCQRTECPIARSS